MTDQHKKPYEPRRFSEPEFEEKTKEKYEKEDGKQEEKHNQDPLSSLVWALILIWAGLVFLASNLGWLDQIRAEPITIGDVTITSLSRWSLIFLGAGVLVFLEAIVRTFVPAYRSSTGGNFFLAAIFIGIGLGMIIGWEIVWPFVLIAMGLSALASALIRHR